MRRTARILTVVLAVAFTLPSYPQEDAEKQAPKTDLQQLNETLREIADLLKKQLDNSELDVYMKRLELSHRRLEPLEQELRSSRSEKDGIEEEQEHLKLMLKNMEESSEARGATGDDEVDERVKREIEGRLEQIKNKAWKIEQKILTLENELTRRQEEIQDLETWIDDRLGLR